MVQLNPHVRRSLEELQQDPEGTLRRLRESGNPEVLTVNGRPELVVQDAAAYQQLLEEIERLEANEAIRRALAEKARGEGRPMREFLHDLAAQHGIKLNP